MPSFKLRKSERLSSKRKISRLFSEGKSINIFPLRILYIIEDQQEKAPPLQFAFSIPKRNFRKAVHRNKLKRKIKEAYRLNKHQLKEELEVKQNSIFGIIIYLDKSFHDYQVIEKSVNKGILKLKKILSN